MEDKYCGLCAVDDPPTVEAACCHVEVHDARSKLSGKVLDEDDVCQYHADCFRSVAPMLGEAVKIWVTDL